MNLKIYEIAGIDNSGKTTQINELKKIYGENNIFIPPSLIEYTTLFPHDLKERINWYKSENVETIIKTTFTGAKERSGDILKINREYTFLDRGYLTLNASLIARTMMKKNKSFNDAEYLVDKIRQKIGYTREEDLSFLLYFKDSNTALNTSKSRSKEPYDADFAEYVYLFNECLNNLKYYYTNIMLINAQNNIVEITKQIKEAVKIMR